MNQEKRNFPSIMLRIALSKEEVTRVYLDALTCKAEMFENVDEMCHANYPEEFVDEKQLSLIAQTMEKQ